MELMTDKAFYPAVGTWRIWTRLTGDDRPIPWLCVDDLGAAAAAVFARPDDMAGETLHLAADVRTLAECRSAYAAVAGRPPRTFPLPGPLFDRFTRGDPTAMWRWLRDHDPPADAAVTRSLVPEAATVEAWLARTLRR